jgi:hypothetical protein
MEPQQSLTVRLLIFSGRPDPEWTLNDQETEQLLGLVRETLGREETNPPPRGGLGYRGFLVRNTQPTFSRLDFSVFRGVLTFDGARGVHRKDVAGVEDLLLTQASDRGYREALEVFGAFQKGGTKSPQQRPFL